MKDADSSLLKHPMNYLTSAMGSVPKTAGMLAGGALAGMAAAPSLTPPVVAASAIAGGGAGGMTGDLIKQYIAQKAGLQDEGTDTQEAVDAAKSGALGEAGGRLIGAGAKAAGSAFTDAFPNFVPRVVGKLSGVTPDAIKRLMSRGDAVMNPRAPLDIAGDAATEWKAGKADVQGRVGAARQAAIESGTPLDTQEAIAHSPDDAFTQKYLSNNVQSPEPLPGALSSKSIPTDAQVIQPAKPAVKFQPLHPEMTVSPPANAQTFYGSKSPYLPPEVGVSSIDRTMAKSGPEQTLVPEQAEVQASPIVGYNNQMPYATPQQLIDAYAKRGEDINASKYQARATGGNVGTSTAQDIVDRQKLKQPLHDAFPDLAASDADYQQFSNDTKLTKPVLRAGQREGFIDRLGNGNNVSDQMAALGRQAPGAHEDVLDLQASRGFDTTTNIGKYLQRQAMHGAIGAGIGAIAGAPSGHSAEYAAGAGAAGLLASPWMAKQFVGRVLPATPGLLGTAAKPVIANKKSPWSLFNQENDQ